MVSSEISPQLVSMSAGPLVLDNKLVGTDSPDTDAIKAYADVFIALASPSVRDFIDQELAANNGPVELLPTLYEAAPAPEGGGSTELDPAAVDLLVEQELETDIIPTDLVAGEALSPAGGAATPPGSDPSTVTGG